MYRFIALVRVIRWNILYYKVKKEQRGEVKDEKAKKENVKGKRRWKYQKKGRLYKIVK